MERGNNMKLNKKGQEAYNKWSRLWDDEISNQEEGIRNGGFSSVEYGWSCTDYLVHNIIDYAEQMIMAYSNDAFYFIRDEIPYVELDDEWSFGMTKRDFLKLLASEYLDMEDDEDINAVRMLDA